LNIQEKKKVEYLLLPPKRRNCNILFLIPKALFGLGSGKLRVWKSELFGLGSGKLRVWKSESVRRKWEKSECAWNKIG